MRLLKSVDKWLFSKLSFLKPDKRMCDEFCNISKNIFFYRTPPVAVSEVIHCFTYDIKYSQNFNFPVLKSRLQDNFWGASTHACINQFKFFLLQLKNQRSGWKKHMSLLYYFSFQRWRFEVKETLFFFEQKSKLKSETESEIKIPRF